VILKVMRGDGSRDGPFLENGLATGEGVLRQLARNFLDENGFDRYFITIEVPFDTQKPVELGRPVDLSFERFDEKFKCKLSGVRIIIDKRDATISYTLERVMTDES